MKKRIIILSFILVIPVPAIFAQLSNKQSKQLETFIEGAMQDWEVPAVGLGIVKGDQILYVKGFGLRNVEKNLAADENTLFAIGSASKAFTAASVMQLVEDELIELDEPIISYLPDFRMMDDYVSHHMTARDLLSHRSGLPRHDILWYGSTDNREALFSKLRYLEPSAGFREVFQYQNLMFMTAGYLVGKMRNSTWEKEAGKGILRALEMNRSNFSVEDSKKDDNHALPYGEKDGEVVAIPFRNLDAIAPAGSINSSPREMCNWLIMQMNGGTFTGKKILGPFNLAQTHLPTSVVPSAWGPKLAFDNDAAPTSYGLGWFLSHHKGRNLVEHGGAIDGFRASVGFLPNEKLGVVVLHNKNGTSLTGIIRNYVFDLLLEEEIRDWNGEILAAVKQAENLGKTAKDELRTENTQPSHSLVEYAGSYRHAAYGLLNVELENDELSVTFHDWKIPLTHYHYDVFQTDEKGELGKNKLNFQTSTSGDIDHVSLVLEPNVDPIIFEKVPEEILLAAEKLEPYLGEYELSGMVIRLWKKDDNQLRLTVPGQPEYTLLPSEEHQFLIKGQSGYKVVFEGPEEQKSSVVFHQPNGVFTAKRKK